MARRVVFNRQYIKSMQKWMWVVVIIGLLCLCYKYNNIDLLISLNEINNDGEVSVLQILRKYEIERLNNTFIKYEKKKASPNSKCHHYIEILQKMMIYTNNYEDKNCLKIKYLLDDIINNKSLFDLTVSRNDVSYEKFIYHITKQNETELMFYLFMYVMYEYNIRIHLTGSSHLSYYRNCNPILLWDNDIDLGIF
eukprot:208442_1